MFHIAEIALFACNPLSRSFLTEERSTHKQESWLLILVDLFYQQAMLGVGSVGTFLLVATRLVPMGTKKMTDPPEEEGGLEGAPVLDQGAEESGREGQGADDQLPERLLPGGEEPVKLSLEQPRLDDSKDEEKKDEVDEEVRREKGEGEADPEGDEEKSKDEDAYEIRVFKMALPLRSKKAREVTRVAMEMVLKLRMDGYHVTCIHSDRGHEFLGSSETWMKYEVLS